MFTLDAVVPWGRSFDEYERMFALGPAERQLRILGCADGPASFNAEADGRGIQVVSCDPLYEFGRDAIQRRIDETFVTVVDQTRRNAHEFVWDAFRSVDDLAEARRASMDTFLADFEEGLRDRRYVAAGLPSLPFASQSFGLALCSHFLFLYTEQLSEDFHMKSMVELCRVAREVRVFPLVALGGRPSVHLPAVLAGLNAAGCNAYVERVSYEFQRGANQMLRVSSVSR